MIAGGAVVLSVADLSRSVRFYVETLGMKLVFQSEPGAAETSIIDTGDGFLIELRADGSSPAVRPLVNLFTKVPLHEAIAIYENRGVSFLVSRDKETPTAAAFEDPDANRLVLLPRPSALDEAAP